MHSRQVVSSEQAGQGASRSGYCHVLCIIVQSHQTHTCASGFTCSPDLHAAFPPPTTRFSDTINSASSPLPPPPRSLTDGQTVLEYYNLAGVNKWAYLGYNSLFSVFFFLCTWLVMAFKRYEKR